jgi:superfamily II DNA or RNA helicase
MREIRFALGYMPHRLWGNILQAQILEKEAGKDFFTPGEYVQNDDSTGAYQRLSPMQREVVRLVDEYSDRNLHRIFSRKKTVKLFQDSVDPEFIREHVRPFIEKRLHQILEVARDMRISVFVKDKSSRNIFPEDFITIEKNPASPVFSFQFDKVLSYTLYLIHGEHRLVLKDAPLEIVSNSPNAILLGNVLYFIDDIDGKKLKPFLTRERVLIPEGFEEKYFASFIRNTLRDYHAITEGFEVIAPEPDCKAELVLEMGMAQKPVWILAFQYNMHSIFPDSPLRRFVNYLGKARGHAFERFERDDAWEQEVIGMVNEVGLHSRDDRNFYLKREFDPEEEDGVYPAICFMNEYGLALLESGINIRHRLNKDYYLDRIELDLESKEKEDWFDVYAVVRFGELSFPFISLKEHILEGRREFELPGGKIAILPEEWFARYRSMFEFGSFSGEKIRIHKQHFSLVDESLRGFHSETLGKLEALNRVGALPETDLPAGLDATLRSYQVEGYQWLTFLQQNGFGGCLADDMGLGKTLQAIAILLRSKEIRKQAGVDKPTSLIVVPASLLHNWSNECRRFAPTLKVLSHVGNQRNRELSNFSYYDVVLSTYHTVRQDTLALTSFRFHYIILDESQMIKNPSSKLYHSMLELQSEHKLVLTGTPIENSLTDLWSQINFVNPGLLGTLNFFKRSFVQPIEKKKDEGREEKLKELINPFILRRTKGEVAQELPPVYEQVRYVDMTDSQKRVYEEEKSLARNSILENLEEAGLDKTSMIVLQALTRLRQIANHPALLEDYPEIDSGKFHEVSRDIGSVVAEGHKVLVFSSFVKHLDLFRSHLESTGTAYAYLTGSRNQRQREEAVKTFQNDPSCSLFLISLKAGGVGLNLTAADYVFILDPWWNPASEMQALSRAHRIGQENQVFVYRFISKDTIEEKIQRLQERKRELAETFVSSNNPLKSLSEKELLELFT